MDRATQPQTAAEEDEANYGDHVLWRISGSTVVAFGGNEKGEIFLSTRKDGKLAEWVIAPDPDFPGGVALFEVEKREVIAP